MTVAALVLAAPSSDRLARLRHMKPEVRWEEVVVSADYDGDGRRDQAVVGHAPGRILVGVLLSSEPTPCVLEFSVGPAEQAAVCSDDAKLRVEDPSVEASDLASAKGRKGLQLADDECDSIHMLWNPTSHRMDWWRL